MYETFNSIQYIKYVVSNSLSSAFKCVICIRTIRLCCLKMKLSIITQTLTHHRFRTLKINPAIFIRGCRQKSETESPKKLSSLFCPAH